MCDPHDYPVTVAELHAAATSPGLGPYERFLLTWACRHLARSRSAALACGLDEAAFDHALAHATALARLEDLAQDRVESL